jgi:hypothetical protein
MDERERGLLAIIASIRSRSDTDARRVARSLANSDRSHPAALAWLRLWRPRVPAPILTACSCETGRCPVCN